MDDLDPSVVSGVIWALFSNLPKDKKKDVMVMLVGEMYRCISILISVLRNFLNIPRFFRNFSEFSWVSSLDIVTN